MPPTLTFSPFSPTVSVRERSSDGAADAGPASRSGARSPREHAPPLGGERVDPRRSTAERRSGVVAHPYRTLAPVVPLATVANETGAVEKSIGLLRSRDTVHPYMYLPPLPGVLDEESVACLFRPSLVSDELLAGPAASRR